MREFIYHWITSNTNVTACFYVFVVVVVMHKYHRMNTIVHVILAEVTVFPSQTIQLSLSLSLISFISCLNYFLFLCRFSFFSAVIANSQCLGCWLLFILSKRIREYHKSETSSWDRIVLYGMNICYSVYFQLCATHANHSNFSYNQLDFI